MKQLISNGNNGKKNLKNLTMSSDVTEWHDVAAGRGSLYNWIMEGASYFSEFDNLGRC